MKKFLSVVTSFALLASSCGGAVRCEAAKATEVNPRVSIKTNNPKKSSFWEEHPSLAKFLKTAGISTAVLLGADVLLKGCAELWFVNYCDFLGEHPETMNKNLTKVENETMEKQQGISWCWNACLTRALFKQGLKDVTQKKVYSATGGLRWWISPLKVERNQTAFYVDKETISKEYPIRSLFWGLTTHPVYLDQINQSVEKLSDGKLEYQNVYIPWNKFEINMLSDRDMLGLCTCAHFSPKKAESWIFTTIIEKILNEVRQNNPESVLITMCPFTPTGHTVTVESIDDKKIVFGEPTSGCLLGMSRDEYFSLENSVFNNEYFRKIYKKGVPINFIVKKGCKISNERIQMIIDESVKNMREGLERFIGEQSA